MPGGKHDVYILKVDGEYRARPAVSPVVHGNGIKFRNLTPFPVTLQFPAGLLKKIVIPAATLNAIPQEFRATVIEALNSPFKVLPPNSKNNNFKFEPNQDGAFSYEAFVEEPGGSVPVVGESGPKIIVDP